MDEKPVVPPGLEASRGGHRGAESLDQRGRLAVVGGRFLRGENIEGRDPPGPPLKRRGGLVGRLAVDGAAASCVQRVPRWGLKGGHPCPLGSAPPQARTQSL